MNTTATNAAGPHSEGPRLLGLLGGMSWESTAIYYRYLNEATRDRLGGLHSARLLVWSFDFADVAHLQHAGDWDGAAALLADAARRLESAGASALVVCTNTMHNVADAIQAAIGIPLLHIADATAAAVRATPSRRPILLGTAFTMEQAFYRGRLAERHGLAPLVPDAEERAFIHRTIYDELCRGQVLAESKARMLAIIARLRAAGGDGLILGCTELCMLLGPDDVDVPVFDTTRIHADHAVEFALG